MIRPIAIALLAAMALITASASGADETFPVIHNEPITVRVLNGQDGLPMAHVHLTLLAGYDQREIHDRLWQQETLTDEQGRAQLSTQLRNLPWLQVLVSKLCQANSRQASFSVERIRRDGLSAPNRCGVATVQEAPGVFTVFVKGKIKDDDAAWSITSLAAQRPAAAADEATKHEETISVQASAAAGNVTFRADLAAALAAAAWASRQTTRFPAAAISLSPVLEKASPIAAGFSPLTAVSTEESANISAQSGYHGRPAFHGNTRRVSTRRLAHRSRPPSAVRRVRR